MITITSRRRPPATRAGITRKLEIGGVVNVYVTLTRDDDGHPCDLLITLNNESHDAPIDPAHMGWANLCATFAGMLFQRGVSVAVVAEKMRGYRFEPASPLGPDGCASIPDAIGRWLMDEVDNKKGQTT